MCPADVLEGLYRRCGAARPGAGPPSKATIWRVVTGADAAAFDAVTGSWLMERASAAGSLACPGHGGDDDPLPRRQLHRPHPLRATLRNLAVGALHLAGRHDTTEATRWASRKTDRPFTILGLTR